MSDGRFRGEGCFVGWCKKVHYKDDYCFEHHDQWVAEGRVPNWLPRRALTQQDIDLRARNAAYLEKQARQAEEDAIARARRAEEDLARNEHRARRRLVYEEEARRTLALKVIELRDEVSRLRSRGEQVFQALNIAETAEARALMLQGRRQRKNDARRLKRKKAAEERGRLARLAKERARARERYVDRKARALEGKVPTCRIPECQEPHSAKGLCVKHYNQWKWEGRPDNWQPGPPLDPKFCRLRGCGQKRFAMGLCHPHYKKWEAEGHPANWKGGIVRVFRTTCVVPDCGEPHKACGYCREHYEAWKRDGRPKDWVPRKLPSKKVKGCKVPNCPRAHMGHGYCRTHYAAWTYAGSPEGWLPTGPMVLQPQILCRVSECGIEVRARGWCNGHYQRWIKLGRPDQCEFLPGPPNRKNVS